MTSNYLRSHPETRDEYGALKLLLAKRFEHDRVGYTEAKAPFIQATIQKAHEWYSLEQHEEGE